MKDRQCRHKDLQIDRFTKITISIVIEKRELEALWEHAAFHEDRIFNFALEIKLRARGSTIYLPALAGFVRESHWKKEAAVAQNAYVTDEVRGTTNDVHVLRSRI